MPSYLSPVHRTVKQWNQPNNSILLACFLMFVLSSSTLFGQATPEWLISTDFVDRSVATNLAVDSFGNSYSTGSFSGKLWLEDSLYVEQCASINFSQNSHFLIKRDQNGTLLWIRYGIGSARIHKILLDAAGNIYTVGQLWSNTLLLSSSYDSIVAQSKSDQHCTDPNIFICQYDSEGKVLRSKILPSKKGQVPDDCLFDPNGNLLIGGRYHYRDPDKPNMVTYSYTLIKLDVNWDLVWKKEGKKHGSSNINAIALDVELNIYVIGSFRKSIYFSKNKLQINGNHYEGRAFAAKYNSSGHLDWVLDSLPPTPTSHGTGIVCDQEQNVYALFNTQYSRAFLIKLKPNGQQIWSKKIEGRQTFRGMLLGNKNHIYLFGSGYTGNFGSSKNANPTLSYHYSSGYSFFIAQYNTYGNLLGLNIEGKEGSYRCQDIALFKNQIVALGSYSGSRKLPVGDYVKKTIWYNSIWVALFNTSDFAIKSHDQ